MKLLVSGFEPFGEFKENPSQKLINNLTNSTELSTFHLKTVLLPVVFSQAFACLKQAIDAFQPTWVVATGVAARRQVITPERIAINWMDAPIPDNDGKQPRGIKIADDQPDGLMTSLPIERMIKAAPEAEISNTAGTYVCNTLMFDLMAYSRLNNFKAGFIHIPPESAMNSQQVLFQFTQMLNVLPQESESLFPKKPNDSAR